jgi:hypothetical protein
MVVTQEVYAARLDIDYPGALDRVTTAFRLIWIIPIAIVLSVLTAQATSTVTVTTTGRSSPSSTEPLAASAARCSRRPC